MAPRRPSTSRGLLERLRFQSHSGRLIRRHRALRRLDFERASIVHPVTLVAGSYALLLVACAPITAGWATTLRFWLPRLGLPDDIGVRERDVLGHVVYEVPFPLLQGALPDRSLLVTVGGSCLALMLLSWLLLRGRALPLAYLVWAGCVLELASCAMLWLAPAEFPHTVASHVANGLEFALLLLLATPLLLTFSFYVFDHSITRKAFGTAVIGAGIVLVAPYQYLVHTMLVEQLSLVVMPPLYVLFGLLFDIAVFVALYAWVVSWEP
ncbi:MAG: hypothetical protein RLW61_17840 [Gammaproteobacteria bacterium]